jgi:5-methylcytosine-specific restriction endonuclease McrBC regulatory subunit McrC
MNHFIYLLSICGQLPRFVRDDVSAASSHDLLALVAHWFMSAISVVFERDLIRDYVETIDDLAAARGQMDPLATSSQYYSGRFILTCRFDDLELDTPLNRILKAGVRLVAGDSEFSASLRQSASRTLQRLDSVGDLRPGDLATRFDRRTVHYEDALRLARLLIERQSRTLAFGGCSAWSFLIPTPSSVEGAVRAILTEHLAPSCVVTNRGIALHPSALTVNPDLIFEPRLGVGDVKYKINWDVAPRPDLYQVVSFASAFHVSRAALVSFRTNARQPLPDLAFGDTIVRHLCWDATEDTSPKDAADGFVAGVRQWLGIGADLPREPRSSSGTR